MKAIRIMFALLCTLGCAQAFSAPKCALTDDTSSRVWIKMNGGGLAILFYCKETGTDGIARWYPHGKWALWGEMPGDWIEQGVELMQGPKAAFVAAWNIPDTATDYSQVKPLYDQMRVEHDPAFAGPALPAPPPAPTCKITPQSTTVLDRAVYKPNAAGTAVGSALTGVRVQQGTPCGARLGTTNYYSVTGQKDTQNRTITVPAYAIGVVN